MVGSADALARPSAEMAPTAPAEAHLSGGRLSAGLATTVLCSTLLVVFAELGASWPVVVVASAGTGMALWLAHARRRLALVVPLVVGCVGLVGIEGVNEAQYGTLSLSGPPALVWWCGDTYRPSGAVTDTLAEGDGPPFSQILTTPAADSVYAVYSGGPRVSCGATGPVLVQIGARRYEVYNP